MADPTDASRTTRAKARPDLPPGTAPWATPSPAEPRPAPAPRPEPSKGGIMQFPSHDGASIWWFVAAVGIGLLCLASLVGTFSNLDDVPSDSKAPLIIATLGRITLCGGLAAAAITQRELSIGVRVAMLLASGYFATNAGLGLLFSSLF